MSYHHLIISWTKSPTQEPWTAHSNHTHTIVQGELFLIFLTCPGLPVIAKTQVSDLSKDRSLSFLYPQYPNGNINRSSTATHEARLKKTGQIQEEPKYSEKLLLKSKADLCASKYLLSQLTLVSGEGSLSAGTESGSELCGMSSKPIHHQSWKSKGAPRADGGCGFLVPRRGRKSKDYGFRTPLHLGQLRPAPPDQPGQAGSAWPCLIAGPQTGANQSLPAPLGLGWGWRDSGSCHKDFSSLGTRKKHTPQHGGTKKVNLTPPRWGTPHSSAPWQPPTPRVIFYPPPLLPT